LARLVHILDVLWIQVTQGRCTHGSEHTLWNSAWPRSHKKTFTGIQLSYAGHSTIQIRVMKIGMGYRNSHGGKAAEKRSHLSMILNH
ncbi:MAG: hypothetical protein ACON5J_07720, partial [Rubripirellula sp.]